MRKIIRENVHVCECVYRRGVCVWAGMGGDGMPNSLCRLKAVMVSGGKSVRRKALAGALLALRGI